jgi:hypothetical protein
MNKKGLLTVKEQAAEFRMSPKSSQRAYSKEEIPMQLLGSWLVSISQIVQRAMAHNGRSRIRRYTAGRDRRPRPAARTAETPPDGNTGALPTGTVTGGLESL